MDILIKMFRKDEGFTLVELMVVVLIIGILVAIAIPVFNAASASARLRSCQSNQRTIEGACEQWLSADPSNARATLAGAVVDAHVLVSAQYLKTRPKCPQEATGATSSYTLSASSTVSCTSPGAHAHY